MPSIAITNRDVQSLPAQRISGMVQQRGEGA